MGTRQLRVLYVEDEEDIREIARIALELVGDCSVELCDCGPAALKRAPQFGPDIIIVDVMMHGMDGVETMHRLKKKPELANTPIVFMTAKVQRSEIEQYLKAGAAAVIPKPFDPLTLADEVRSIWRQFRFFDPTRDISAPERFSAAAEPASPTTRFANVH